MSRTKKTAMNSIVGLSCTIVSSVLSFVLRAMFIRLLGLEYAGIDSVFADILSILNLADLGFNNAILFRLYKSIAQNNREDTELYLSVYKKICYAVGAFIGIVGLCFIPYLGVFMNKAPSFREPLWSLYIIVLFNSVVSHCVNYKSILIIAKQDRYITTIIQYTCIFLKHGLQIIALAFYKNIYIYLLVPTATTVLSGALNGVISRKRYPETWKSNRSLDKLQRQSIVKDVGALSVYKFCRTIDATIDTFLISKFVDVTVTAIYGSISMLLSALNELLGVFNDAMIASIGDLNASSSKENLEKVFYQAFHLNYLLYGVCTAALVPFLSDFTKWWIGYSLDAKCIYIVLLNFFMYGFGVNVATFRNAMGIFQKGWLRPAMTAIINLICSTVLVLKIGLAGTLLGTLIARTLTLVWFDPWLVLHHGMKKTVRKYYLRYFIYLVSVIITAISLVYLNMLFSQEVDLFILLVRGVVSALAAAIALLLLGSFIPEQRDLIQRGLRMLSLKRK